MKDHPYYDVLSIKWMWGRGRIDCTHSRPTKENRQKRLDRSPFKLGWGSRVMNLIPQYPIRRPEIYVPRDLPHFTGSGLLILQVSHLYMPPPEAHSSVV